MTSAYQPQRKVIEHELTFNEYSLVRSANNSGEEWEEGRILCRIMDHFQKEIMAGFGSCPVHLIIKEGFKCPSL